MKQISTILLLLTVFSISAYSQNYSKAELAKKIEDATPKPLPQSPIVKKLKSDAEDEGLKGKVKKVIREIEDLSGTWKVQGKKIEWITDYDENGNRLKELFYDSNALPRQISVFGYLDGMRVNNSETIRFSENPPLMAAGNRNRPTATKAPDPRYDFSFEYKYTNEKLTEMKWVKNNGAIWMTRVFNYKGNQVEELIYSEDGKLNQKYLSILDDKGNEIERTMFNVLGVQTGGDTKYSIKYESFDEKGNWTKKTTSELVVENGKENYQPIYVNYRTITYYP